MPPQPSSCCRAVRHRITTPRDSIWVSDSQLATAFERFCRISQNSRRSVSNVPGPLECRRRLGKRRIADLQSMQLHPSLPPWALPTAPDLSQWRWQPPTDLFTRLQGQNTTHADSLRVPVLEWLVGSPQKEQESRDVQAETISPEPEPVHQKDPLILQEVEDLRTPMASMPFVNKTFRKYHAVCEHLGRRIASASLTAEEVQANFIAVCEMLDRQENDLIMSGRASGTDLRKRDYAPIINYAPLIEAVVRGIASCKLPLARELPLRFLRLMINRLARTSQRKMLELFPQLVDMARLKGSRSRVPLGTHRLLKRLFSLWESGVQPVPQDFFERTSGFVDLSQRAESYLQRAHALVEDRELAQAVEAMEQASLLIDKCSRVLDVAHELLYPTPTTRGSDSVAMALGCLGRAHLEKVVRGAIPRIKSRPASIEADPQQSRHYWLACVSRMEGISEAVFLDTVSQLYDSAEFKQSISNYALCQLVLERWKSLGFTRNSMVIPTFGILFTGRQHACLGELALTVYSARRTLPNRAPVYKVMWDLVHHFGRTNDLITGLEALLSPKTKLRREFLHELALSSGDLGAAIKLHDLYNTARARNGFREYWVPSFWESYAEQGKMDSLATTQLVEILDLGIYKTTLTRDRRDMPGGGLGLNNWRIGPATVALLNRLAVRCALEPDLAPRVRLRYLEYCKRMLEYHGYKLPPQIHKAILHVITMDLSMGQPGRIERFRWFLGTVKRYYGEGFMMQCGQLLNGWRDGVLWQVRQEKTQRLR
ncbi:uncharacterized protein E0L32_000572 [Thyridium curvatum]|uniref:Uncharacterized protein n=1 Tax=Thyridium curvatum TaxID=1093900 RepID=A0A507BBF9_9PEZI|nr:uncharacterized protein E0L32_000572 [Thyridium curvatum]TPX14178.1 hypothetical protein E0L32_000572 [Thyridium curvatum]